MTTEELKKKYGTGVLWSMVYENSEDPKIKEQMPKVIDKIAEIEEALTAAGVSGEWKDEVIQRARSLTKKTVGEMSDRELEMIIKIIFGGDGKLEPYHPRPGDIIFDPTKPTQTSLPDAPVEIKYVTYEHKKPLWQGTKISIRSYVVEQALSNGTGIRVKHGGQTMSLSPDKLKSEAIHNRDNRHAAKSSASNIEKGEDYYLIDYRFVPDKT